MKAEAIALDVNRATLRVLRSGVVATAVALVVNVLIWWVSGNLLGISFIASPPPGSAEAFHVTAANVVIDTLVGGGAATLVFALIVRVFARPVPPFLVISGLVLLASFLMPLLLETDAATKAVLSLMHIAAAVIIVGGLTRQTANR
jgi:hypothetical protein